MVTKQYIVFTDLDGTLLDHHSYSFDAAKPMLNQLKELGISVVPNTSKTYAELLDIRQQAELNSPFIVENGAAIYIPKMFFNQQPADTEEQGEYWVKAFSKPRNYWLELLEKTVPEYEGLYLGFSRMTDEQLSMATGLSLDESHRANERGYSEPLQWLGTEEQKSALSIKMRAAGANVLQGGRFVHISGKCNKGLAMNWLVKTFNQQHTNTNFQCIALGDSFNDNDMLEAADIAVQIRSPKHDFPELFRTDNLYQSQHMGPRGWSECLSKILNIKEERQYG